MTSAFRAIPAALVFSGVLLVPTAARAQSLGVQGGASWSDYDFKTTAPTTSQKWGGTAGVFVQLGRGIFGGLVEANWLQRGTKLSTGTEITVDYLEVPVAASIGFGSSDTLSLRAEVGGAFAFKLKQKQTGLPIFADPEVDIDGFDHGVIAGAMFSYKQLVARGRYTWGTRDLSDRPVEAYNRGWTFLVGVRLLGRN